MPPITYSQPLSRYDTFPYIDPALNQDHKRERREATISQTAHSSLQTIIYDTETTGPKPLTDRIIELSGYDPTSGKVFSSLCNPKRSIPAPATKVHHISDKDVKDAPPFKKVSEIFRQFVGEKALLVAHNNAGFDQVILNQECQREEVSIPQGWMFFDTLTWLRIFHPGLTSYKQQDLCQKYGVDPGNAHRASDDTIALENIWSKIEPRKSLLEAYHYMRTEILVAHKYITSLTSFEKAVMPFGPHEGLKLEDLPYEYLLQLCFTKNDHECLDRCEEDKKIREALNKLAELIGSRPPRTISIMPFGKYKNTPLSDLPTRYLFWLRQERDKHSCHHTLKDVLFSLKDRLDSLPSPHKTKASRLKRL
ncbi:MAG: putative quorum-sensing-regulated virulence factor [Chlamydiota bacterium]